MPIELKPCPFCGGEAEIMSNLSHNIYWVQCTNCISMMGRDEMVWSAVRGEMIFNKEENAVEAWNRRV